MRELIVGGHSIPITPKDRVKFRRRGNIIRLKLNNQTFLLRDVGRVYYLLLRAHS
jgi:hypothetical protein